MKIKDIDNTIKILKKTLKKYRDELENSPDSIFYKGIVKNTEEYIKELKEFKKNKKKNKNESDTELG